MEQRSTRLDNEILMYKNLLKVHQVANLKREFEERAVEESVSSGKTGLRDANRDD